MTAVSSAIIPDAFIEEGNPLFYNFEQQYTA